MRNRLAKILTNLFDPLVITTVAVITISAFVDTKNSLAGLVFLSLGGLLPAALLAIQYYNTKINRVVDRMERNDVFTAAFISFAAISILFTTEIYQSNLWYMISAAFAVYFGLTLLTNYVFDKVSQHAGIFCFWVLILMDKVDTNLGALILILPVIMWTRLLLKKHTVMQLLWGSAVGMFAALLTWPW